MIDMRTLTPRAVSIECIEHPEWGSFGVSEDRGDYYEIRGARGSRVLSKDEAAKFWRIRTSTIVLDGITYEIVMAKTADSADADGLHNMARVMREKRQLRHLYMKRPRGNRIYFAIEYAGRSNPDARVYSSVTSLGAWS
jgi:hypothetical protein